MKATSLKPTKVEEASVEDSLPALSQIPLRAWHVNLFSYWSLVVDRWRLDSSLQNPDIDRTPCAQLDNSQDMQTLAYRWQ